MIRLFFIKNKQKDNKIIKNDDALLKKYTEISKQNEDEILKEYDTNIEKGLNSKQVDNTLEKEGKNIVVKRKNIPGYISL